jgi:putative hydrolase of the HAD superfamily
MIKAIIFDLDNTLIDFMKVKRVAIEAAVEAMIDAGLKMPKEEMVEKIYKAYGEETIEDQHIFDKVLEREFGHIDYRILASGITGYRRAKEGTMSLYPHVDLTLTMLTKMAIKMIIVTDAPKLPVWMRISVLGSQHYFEHILTYEDTEAKKPSPKPFQIALDILKVKPDEVLMVGDWAECDVVGAKQLGMKTAFARYGDTFETKDSGADYELNDILELVDVVRRENEK